MSPVYEIRERSEWREPIAVRKPIAFLQSWSFGSFLNKIGRVVMRWGISNNPEDQIQGIITPTIKSFFVYLPHIHISDDSLHTYSDYFRDQGAAFMRIEPAASVGHRHGHIVRDTYNRQAQHHWLFDVADPEEKLLAKMHQKTRYNIRLATKKGVRIVEEKNPGLFLRLEKGTARRKGGFDSPQNLKYYEALLDEPECHQTTAYYEKTPVASSILRTEHGVMTYLFGGSDERYRSVMAPTLLQWYNIALTKRLGQSTYNFLGIAPPASDAETERDSFHGYTWNTRHPYSVLTRFKAGFGGRVESFAPAKDIVFQPVAHALHCLKERIRR